MNDADRTRAKLALALGRRSVEHPPLEQLVAWHEKALNTAQSKSIQKHVAHCDQCFALWSGLVDMAPAEQEQVDREPVRRVRWWHFAAPAAALGVVAVSFWIGLMGGAPLPAYSLDVRGGLIERGGIETTLNLRDDTLLQILVAPASAVEGQVEAMVFAESSAGLVALDAQLDVTDKGVASLEALVGSDIVIAPDTRRLVIVVGREGALPSANELLDGMGDRSSVIEEDWQAFAVQVEQ